MRSRSFILVFLLATLSLAQVSSELLTPEIRRVGFRLACLCGSCKNSVGDCAMLECHYSKPARERIKELQAKGLSDDAIVDDFVKREGKRALVVPPAEGFNRLAFLMTPFMVGLGLALIYWYIRRSRKPVPVLEVDSRVLDQYKDSIEKDLAKLD